MEKGGAFSDLFPGFNFRPTDQELLVFHLRRKVEGHADQFYGEAIPVVDLFGPDALPPWRLHPAVATSNSTSKNSSSSSWRSPSILPSNEREWYYCFAHTSRRGSGARRTTRWGTWLTSGGDKPVTTGSGGGENGVTLLGYKNTLAFKIPAAGDGGGGSKWFPTCWIMNEYKLQRGDDAGGPEVRRARKAASFPAAPTKKRKNECRRDPSEGSSPAPELVLCSFRCTRPMNPSELNSEFGALLQQPDHDEEELGIRAEKKQRTGYSPRRFDCRTLDSSLGEHKVAAPTTPDAVDAEAPVLPSSSSSSSSSSPLAVEQQQQEVVVVVVPGAAAAGATTPNSAATTPSSCPDHGEEDADGIDDMDEVWQMLMADDIFPLP